MSYSVRLPRSISRALRRLPNQARLRIDAAIYQLREDPRPHGCRMLVGLDAWRLRVGDYRIVYLIDDDAQVVTIAWVGHRSNAYQAH